MSKNHPLFISVEASQLISTVMNKSTDAPAKTLGIMKMLKPHFPALALGLLAAIGEGIANLLDPWPLKIVLDDVLRSQYTHGWLNRFIFSTFGSDKLAVLKFAVLAVFLIAVAGALCSYAEKYLTT